jgi:hypothetical protein
MADLSTALMGIGAAFKGQAPQFLQQQQQRQAQERAQMLQNEDLAEKRKLTLFKDAAMMKANPEMAGSILQDRLAQIQRFNDMGVPVDPKHTQEMMQLYQSGDMNAFSGYLDNVLESGYVTGALDRPPKPEEYTLAKGARRFSGSREIASNVPVEPGYTQLTTQEVKDLGLDETKQYQKSPQGQITAIGGGGQTFNIGGEELSPGLKKLDEIYAQEYYDWRSQRSTALSNMASIGQVLGKLERGEKLSGPAIGMQPDFIRAIMNPEATQAIETVQSVVQQNLRQVLGGQFAQQEAAQLLSRAFNPTLAPEYNAERLRKLYAQMEIAAEQKDAMSEYFEKNGSLSGYTGEQPNITDFYVAMSKYDIGDISNGYRYLGGDDQIQSSWEEVK